MSRTCSFLSFSRFLMLSLVATLLFAGCSKGKSAPVKKGGGLKFPVEVATVAARETELVVHAVGSVEAFEIVPVTARVAGVVQEVRFKEGDAVRAGEQLIEIEPDRYQLALKSAEATLERATAALREARAGLLRRTDIQGKNPGFVSSEDLENWQTRALGAQADSAQAAANLELARLNLRDAYVPAPVSGTIESRIVRTGQYVQPGTVIATIVRRDPLLLRFAIPESDAKRIRTGMEVLFTVRGDELEHRARISAITESADLTTRMVSVTAEVRGEAKNLPRPGSFAEVTVKLGESEKLPVIPQLCIRPSERGFLAYVVTDSTAFERVLTLGLQSNDGYVEVRSGISIGETVVVRGAEALRDGAAVRIVRRSGADSSNAEARGQKS